MELQSKREWGIEPIPADARRLGLWDFFVLWGDLGIGLLVLAAGSLLVPGLSLGQAFLAILVGSVVGCTLLALAGIIGSQTGAPTMVCLRPFLGLRGSYLPTVVNVLQLIGWTVFELVIMGHAANAVSKQLFAWDAYVFWTALFAAIVILMGVGGPVAVIRQWLSRYAVWAVLVTTLWLSWYLFTHYNLLSLLTKPGTGELSFWAAVDIVIAMPISWMPLVADYNRFAKRAAPAFWGTWLGYLVANLWFYGLGAVILLASGVKEPTGFVTAIATIAGPLAVLILLVDETDEGWADLYSTAVSIQNVFPKLPQRWLILGLGLFSFVVAALLDITQYEDFLLLIGSVFVPLFGCVIADYFLVRRQVYDVEELYRPAGAYWYLGGVNWLGVIAWALGIVVYLWIAKGLWLGQGVPWLGASVPSFLSAGVAYLLLARFVGREQRSALGTR